MSFPAGLDIPLLCVPYSPPSRSRPHKPLLAHPNRPDARKIPWSKSGQAEKHQLGRAGRLMPAPDSTFSGSAPLPAGPERPGPAGSSAPVPALSPALPAIDPGRPGPGRPPGAPAGRYPGIQRRFPQLKEINGLFAFLLHFADKTVVDFNLLGAGVAFTFHRFMDDDLLDQGI